MVTTDLADSAPDDDWHVEYDEDGQNNAFPTNCMT